jgi:AraC-like DNA-binding protein
MAGYTFFPVHPRLKGVIEAIWDTDFPNPGAARSVVLPLVSPILCFHYRSPPLLRANAKTAGGGETWIDPGRYRMTGIYSKAARLRASGPVGGVMVRLRPESAICIRGICLREFSDQAFSLIDVFTSREISLLDEKLLEAPNASARVSTVQALFLDRLHDRQPDVLVHSAARMLRRNVAATVRELASRLDVSERHLARRFNLSLGVAPKQFARIVRIGKVVAAGRNGEDWAGIAAQLGFNDQSHMINDFTAMVGLSPELLFRMTSLGRDRTPKLSAAESDFYNTFVAEATMPS